MSSTCESQAGLHSEAGRREFQCSFAMLCTRFSFFRKMRLSQKTVYQTYQATNMPGNFWLMHQLKDFGCPWGKKSKLCSVSMGEFQVTLLSTHNLHTTTYKVCSLPFFYFSHQALLSRGMISVS